MLRLESLHVSHGEVPVLHDISLAVGASEVVALLGPNGAGKTTLLRTISGLHPAAQGGITFEGQALAGRPAHAIARAGLAHVPEGRGILGELTVMENLRLGAYARGGASAELERVFELFPRLSERRTQTAAMLSGGEQQMLAIGRALLSRPKLLLIDELSLGLAPKIAAELLALIGTLAADGLGILVVEQNVRETLKVAHRACVLVQGRVVFDDASSRLGSREAVMNLYHGAG